MIKTINRESINRESINRESINVFIYYPIIIG